jgi:hypothetical protein
LVVCRWQAKAAADDELMALDRNKLAQMKSYKYQLRVIMINGHDRSSGLNGILPACFEMPIRMSHSS